MKKYTAVLLAAGEGTRMKSSKPKVLHEAAGLPMIGWPLSALREAGIPKIVVVTGPDMQPLKEAAGEGVLFAKQAERRGTGHAAKQAAPFLDGGGYVVILPGDMPLITADTIRSVGAAAENGGYDCVLLTAYYEDPTGYGRVIRDADGSVLRIVEEANATAEEKKIREANAFVYCVRTSALLECLEALKPKPPKNEYYLTDMVELIRGSGGKVGAVSADAEECLGVNDRVQLAQVSGLLRQRIAKKHMLSGVTLVDPANTYIDAKTKIGTDTVIYPGVVLEDSVIGSDAILYQGSRIFKSRIGDRLHRAEFSGAGKQGGRGHNGGAVRIPPAGHADRGRMQDWRFCGSKEFDRRGGYKAAPPVLCGRCGPGARKSISAAARSL